MMEKNVKAYTYLFLTPKLIQFEICKLARAVVMVMEIALLVQQSYKLMGFCERKLFKNEEFIQSETVTESGDFKSILIVH